MNMQWNNIVGHKQVVAQLCLMQQEDRIPHAMLFCGTDGVGKSLVAEALAAAILCHAPVHNQACGHCKACQALAAGTHPDFFQIQPESETKAAPAIRIEAVRKLQEEIARIPLLSERRVVIMQEADKMNEAAANCLLKTIEEPSGQIVFILLTSRPFCEPGNKRRFPIRQIIIGPNRKKPSGCAFSSDIFLTCRNQTSESPASSTPAAQYQTVPRRSWVIIPHAVKVTKLNTKKIVYRVASDMLFSPLL